MHRFFAGSDIDPNHSVLLDSEDARHAVTVLRLKPSQQVEVVSRGHLYQAEIIRADLQEVRVRLLFSLPSTEPILSVTLFQGLPKSDKMDWIVQKATEIGISRIVPVRMNRCIVRPDSKDLSRKLDRWHKIAREAVKQSGRCVVPEICSPVSIQCLSDYMQQINIVPWEEANGYGPLALHKDYPSVSSLSVLIGPEGGIDPDEIAMLRLFGFVTITLGKRILRTETAGLAAVSALMALYGEME